MQEYLDFAQRHLLLVVAFIATAGIIIWAEYQRLTKSYKDLNAQEMVQLINHDDPLLLDVREANELTQGVIKGAKHIPMSNLVKRLSELDKYKDRKIITYCRSGQRSSHACRILTKHQFTDVYHLAGGVLTWDSANLPMGKK
jgi:rhodanese-related sulfurtransferase